MRRGRSLGRRVWRRSWRHCRAFASLHRSAWSIWQSRARGRALRICSALRGHCAHARATGRTFAAVRRHAHTVRGGTAVARARSVSVHDRGQRSRAPRPRGVHRVRQCGGLCCGEPAVRAFGRRACRSASSSSRPRATTKGCACSRANTKPRRRGRAVGLRCEHGRGAPAGCPTQWATADGTAGRRAPANDPRRVRDPGCRRCNAWPDRRMEGRGEERLRPSRRARRCRLTLILRSPQRFASRAIRATTASRRSSRSSCRAICPPRPQPYCVADVRAAVASVHAAIEVVDSRFLDIGAVDALSLLADFQSNGALVVDDGLAMPQAFESSTQQVALHIDGVDVLESRGSNPAGDVLSLLAWLANHAAARSGGLRRGDIVTTGSWTGMRFVGARTRVKATFAGIGGVDVEF